MEGGNMTDHQLEVDLALGLDPEIAMQGYLLRQALAKSNEQAKIALRVLESLRELQKIENDIQEMQNHIVSIGPRVERDRQAETGENSPKEDRNGSDV